MIEECLAVEIRVTGDDCPLAEATRTTGVAVDAHPPQLRHDGNALLRFDAPATEALARTLDADDRVRYLHVARGSDRFQYRCLSTDPCVVHDLVSGGFLAASLRYHGDDTVFTGAVVGREVLEGIVDRAAETVGVSLERVNPLGPDATGPVGRVLDLTDKQREALHTAHSMGYFAVPRETTAAEVAAELGIGKTAFLERVRRGERRLVEQLL
ncbi:MAG: helix-turn-helix domain-containing protein [Halobacteriaceae archaeon]